MASASWLGYVQRAICMCALLYKQQTSATTRYLPPSAHGSWSAVEPFPSQSELSSLSDILSDPSAPLETETSNSNASATTASLKSTSKSLHKDIIMLSRLLPGVYTNTQQYHKDAEVAMPNEKRHMLLRSVYRRVQVEFLPKAFAVLVQDYSGDSQFPYRQRVHTFSVDVSHHAIRMKIYNFATSGIEKKATNNLNYFRKLRRKDLVSQGACDMYWRRLNRNTFVGITGKECLGYVHGEQVRISVSTTLTSYMLQTNEGWYRARDGQKLVEIDVPYSLVKTKSFLDKGNEKERVGSPSPGYEFLPYTAFNDLPVEGQSTSLPPDLSVHRSNAKKPHENNNINDSQSHEDNLHQIKPSINEDDENESEETSIKDKGWVLTNYEAIIKALHSGRLVFYSVELSACSLPQQSKEDRHSFGDFIESFETFVGTSKSSVRFWQTKYLQGDEGMEELMRDITVQSNGRVLVQLYRKYQDSNKVAWNYLAQCKLFDPETGLGGVKLTSQPSAPVQEIATYGRLRSALRRGKRQVRMVADLTKCEGRTGGLKSTIGITISAYDFLNNGKAIEITQLARDVDNSRDRLLTGHFLLNGEVIFITSFHPSPTGGNNRHFPVTHQVATYRCALSGSSISKNHGPHGVRLFYKS